MQPDTTFSPQYFKGKLKFLFQVPIKFYSDFFKSPSDLKIKLTYSDVEERGRYEKEEIIHIDIDENGELISRMLKREQQRTVEIGKKEVNGNK